MPHVIVKMWPGRSNEQKNALAQKISAAVVEAVGCEEKSVSVAIEEVPKERWAKDVYKPDIESKPGTLFKRPGYSPSDEELA